VILPSPSLSRAWMNVSASVYASYRFSLFFFLSMMSLKKAVNSLLFNVPSPEASYLAKLFNAISLIYLSLLKVIPWELLRGLIFMVLVFLRHSWLFYDDSHIPILIVCFIFIISKKCFRCKEQRSSGPNFFKANQKKESDICT